MTAHKQILVVIIDDHSGVRHGLRQILERSGDFRVVGEGADGREALLVVAEQQPDVVLLDVEIPQPRGDEVLKVLRHTQPHVRVLAVSSYDDQEHVEKMLESGAAGYLVKEDAPRHLVNAVRLVMQGKRVWLSPRIAARYSG